MMIEEFKPNPDVGHLEAGNTEVADHLRHSKQRLRSGDYRMTRVLVQLGLTWIEKGYIKRI